MIREYVYFLSHAPIGSLCGFGSLRSLSVISHVKFNTKEKLNQKERSCPPSQQRTLRPFPYTSAIRQELVGYNPDVNAYVQRHFLYRHVRHYPKGTTQKPVTGLTLPNYLA